MPQVCVGHQPHVIRHGSRALRPQPDQPVPLPHVHRNFAGGANDCRRPAFDIEFFRSAGPAGGDPRLIPARHCPTGTGTGSRTGPTALSTATCLEPCDGFIRYVSGYRRVCVFSVVQRQRRRSRVVVCHCSRRHCGSTVTGTGHALAEQIKQCGSEPAREDGVAFNKVGD
jgi:hypothetical protein